MERLAQLDGYDDASQGENLFKDRTFANDDSDQDSDDEAPQEAEPTDETDSQSSPDTEYATASEYDSRPEEQQKTDETDSNASEIDPLVLHSLQSGLSHKLGVPVPVLRQCLQAVASIDPAVPTTVAEAQESPHWPEWKAAMDREMESIRKAGTYQVAELPAGKKAVKNRWVFEKRPGRQRSQDQGSFGSERLHSGVWTRLHRGVFTSGKHEVHPCSSSHQWCLGSDCVPGRRADGISEWSAEGGHLDGPARVLRSRRPKDAQSQAAEDSVWTKTVSQGVECCH